MTRKDYKLIAEVFSRCPNDSVAEFLALALADKLAQDNPRFDRNKFLIACGVKGAN